MSNELQSYQINYDNILKDLTYKLALSAKIKEKASELQKTQSQANTLVTFRAKVQAEALAEQCKGLQAYMDAMTKRHQKFNPYKHYQADLADNIAVLDQRKTEYEGIYSPLPLVFEDKEGEYLRPKLWSLDTSSAVFPPAFKPTAKRSSASHPAKEKLNTVIQYEKKYDYSFASFRYADDDTVLDHRFFLYWGLDEPTSYDKQNSGTEPYRPDQLYAAYVIGGYATQLHISSEYLSNSTRLEDDEYYNKRYTLARPLSTQYMGAAGDYSKAYRHSDTRIKLNRPTGFLLYPLDQTPFTTKKLSEIAALEAPSYSPSYLTTQKVVFNGGDNEAPPTVYLHCSLPEWNYRLRKTLADLQLQIKEYNLLLSPHFSKLNEVAKMRETVELHTRHCFNAPDKSSKDLWGAAPLSSAIKKLVKGDGDTNQQLQSRKKLADTLDDLYEGIQTIIDAPNRINTATELLYNEKKHIDECARDLWELMQSPAFIAEFTSYIDYVKTQDQDIEPGSGIIPSGPYMAKDENWDTIFYTIAECYAGLSASDQYRDLAWNEDIIHGIDLITTIGHKGNTAELINKDWSESNTGADKADYLSDQFEKLERPQSFSAKSLFSLIAENYSTFLKPYLGHVIPGPGAPCTLQVILSCYQPQVFSHILNTVRKDITYHIRLFRGVSMLFGILNENKPDVHRLLGRDVKDIFSALIVTKDLRKSRGRAEKTTKAFAAYFAAADADDKHGPSEKFYQKTVLENKRKLVSHGASYSKSIYTLFNLALSIQTLQALDEVAKDKGWSEERLFLEHTYAITQVAMAAGGSTMAMLNVAKRINYLGVSSSVTKGVTRTISEGLEKLLNTATIHITVLATVLSAYQAAEHIQNQRYREALYSGISASANIMLTAGFVIKRAAKKAAENAAKRAAAQLVVSGITASTVVGAPLAGVFIIVGTAVNIVMLAYDTTVMLKTLLASNAQKILVSQWQNFQQPAPELTVAMLENFGLKRTRGSGWSTKVWSLEHNAYLNHSDDIINLYNTTPHEIYTGKHGGWQNTALTVEPIKIIEDLHNQEVFDAEGVRLGKLSWRAVVPLHNLGIPAETIDKMVDFGISLYDELFTHGMESASDIITYYQEAHKNWSSVLIPAEMPDNFNIETETKELKHIAILLEQGHFTPPLNAVFHRAVDWKHPTFQTPDIHL